jgi:hypothetical protein
LADQPAISKEKVAGENKNGAPASAFAPLGNVASFAQSLREPFSPRSSECFRSKLAKMVLRVNATEVKKKFRWARIEIAAA